VSNVKFVIKLYYVNEKFYFGKLIVKFVTNHIFSHVIEAINQRSKIWQKSTKKCLNIEFGRSG